MKDGISIRKIGFFFAVVFALALVCIFAAVQPASAGEYYGGLASNSAGDGGGNAKHTAGAWWLGDEDATTASVDKVAQARYGDNAKGGDGIKDLRGLVQNAVDDCDARARAHGHPDGCREPRLVAMGWFECDDPIAHPGWLGICRNGNGIGAPSFGITNWPVRGNILSTGQGLPEVSTYDMANSRSSQHQVMVVLSWYEYNIKGWKRPETPNERVDVASASSTSTETLSACPVYFYMSGAGIDGYAKGDSAEQSKWLTPYGDFYNAIAKGESEWDNWTFSNGTRTNAEHYKWFKAEDWPEYKDDPALAAKLANEAIKKAHDAACENTDKMSIDYKVANVDGNGNVSSVPAKEYKGESTSGTMGGGDSGRQLIVDYVKGGIYKTQKSQRSATVTITKMKMNHYKRYVTFYQYGDLEECRQGDPGCGHWNKTKEQALAEMGNGVEDPFDGGRGYFKRTSGWIKMDDKAAVSAVAGDRRIDGKNISGIFHKGEGDDSSEYDIGVNTVRGINWFAGGEKNWQQGQGGDLPGKLHPVSNELQSIVTIAVQDFVTINCNRIDFEKYVEAIRGKGYNVNVDSDTKYNGTAHSDVISASANGASPTEPFTRVTSTIGYEFVNPAGTPEQKTKWQSTYDSIDYKTTRNGVDFVNDPVYTKECPFDCTYSSDATSPSANTAPTPDPNSGVYSRSSAAGTDTAKTLESSTKKMTFFRNNENNFFRVNSWYPVDNDNGTTGIKGQGINSAKSVLITRNPNGTPWGMPGSDKTLTTLTARTLPTNGSKPDANKSGPDNPDFDTRVFTGGTNIEDLTSFGITQDGGNKLQQSLSGNVRDFKIRSTWATDQEDLKFNLKYEYLVNNRVPVYTNSTSVSSNITANQRVNTVAKSTGYCYWQDNASGLSGSMDTTQLFHDNTGFTVNNKIDQQQQDYLPTFEIEFVRATGSAN